MCCKLKYMQTTTYYWRIKFWDSEGALQDLEYTYDAVGNITKIVDSSDFNGAKTVEYEYDDLYRLTRASSTDAVSGDYLETHTYSALGNITNKSDMGNYTYAETNYTNPHAVTDINGTTYAYDNNGNLTNDETWTHGWDYRNRLKSSANGTINLTYQYDHDVNRIMLGNGTATTTFANKYYNISTATTTKHIYAGSELVATITGDGSATSTYYIHTDHLSGSNVITDESGEKEQLIDYYPFGGIRLNESVNFNQTKKFTGHEYDNESELTYANARYYNQDIGRWISMDPAGRDNPGQFLTDPQQMNGYSYARNNPLRLVDRNGNKVAEYQPYLPSGQTYREGDKLGGYRGSIIFSSGPRTGLTNHVFQCVNWVKDFARAQFGIELGGTGNASAYGKETNINAALDRNNSSGSYSVYENSGNVMPQENDIMTWSGGSYGHVGVVAEVVFDEKSGNGWVYTLEQNASRDRGLFAQPFAHSDDGAYTVESRGNLEVQSWARYDNDAEHEYTKTQHTPAPKQAINP